jgi:hypothetical protein
MDNTELYVRNINNEGGSDGLTDRDDSRMAELNAEKIVEASASASVRR